MDVTSYLLGKKAGGGSGGTTNYNELSNKPQINDVTLSGNKTLSDLGLQSEITSSNKLDASLVDDSLSTNKFTNASEKATWNGKADISDIPTAVSELTNDSGYQTLSEVEALISGLGAFDGDYFQSVNTRPFSLYDKKPGVYVNSSLGMVDNFYYKSSANSGQLTLNNKNYIMIVIFKDINEAEINDYIGAGIGLSYGGVSNNGKIGLDVIIKNGEGSININSTIRDVQFITNESQSFTGTKRFVTTPEIVNYTVPSLNTQLVAKKYVDDSIASAITTTLNGSY